MDVADSSQLGTPDRLRIKEERMAHHGMPKDIFGGASGATLGS